MLLIVTLTAMGERFIVGAFQQLDSALTAVGFKKEVQSVLKPGKEVSVTYEGPNLERANLEGILTPISEQNQFTYSIEIEESVRFP